MHFVILENTRKFIQLKRTKQITFGINEVTITENICALRRFNVFVSITFRASGFQMGKERCLYILIKRKPVEN